MKKNFLRIALLAIVCLSTGSAFGTTAIPNLKKPVFDNPIPVPPPLPEPGVPLLPGR